VVILFLIVATIFFTELASNTASANIIIPIVIAFAGESELSPLVCAFAFAIACNSAFMLPVATPPNVIVFGTNRIKKLSMIKTGLVLNLLGALLISLFVVVFVKM
jgi:sodium-dependent dicarboxylate transporter 2/3/5